jgi:hypothetical protein
MAISYTLIIGSVKKRLTEGEFSDVIVEASFGVSAESAAVTTGSEEEGNLVITQPSFSYSCGGTRTFSVEGLTAENFVSFADVTKDTIKNWLLASEGVTDVEEFSYVKSSIENIAKRIHDYGLEVRANVAGTNSSGTSTYTYTPPEPTPEPTPEETPAE